MTEKQEEYHIPNMTGSLPFNYSNFAQPSTTYVHSQQQFVSGVATLLATLTDAEKENIRQIVAEEVQKVFPVPHQKPDVGIPECPDCGGWDLDEHDILTPLDTVYRTWWCVCPGKVAAWEARCKADLDRLLEAIQSDESEIEAILVDMSSEEFEGLIAKVKSRREQA